MRSSIAVLCSLWLLGQAAVLAQPSGPGGDRPNQQQGRQQTDRVQPTAEEQAINGRYLLTDANGRTVTNADFPGQFQLISFGYTYCPDVCPTTLAETAAILRRLGDAAEQVQPIFITVDPERDTPDKLRTYTNYFHPRLIGLTGSPDLIKGAARNFGVRYRKVVDPNAPTDRYPVDHSAGLFLLGPDGGYIRKFGFGTPVDAVAKWIEAALPETPAGGES
jgi:protein SCO1/2